VERLWNGITTLRIPTTGDISNHGTMRQLLSLFSFILATGQELEGTRESGLVVSNDGKTTKIPWLVILPLTEDRDKTWAAHIIAVDHVESLPAKQRSS
jgi:hypothetical protein